MLGSGAFDTVYQWRWVCTPVAIKEIAMKRKDVLGKQISQEVKLHSLARHPNILQIMGYTFTKKNRYESYRNLLKVKIYMAFCLMMKSKANSIQAQTTETP